MTFRESASKGSGPVLKVSKGQGLTPVGTNDLDAYLLGRCKHRRLKEVAEIAVLQIDLHTAGSKLQCKGQMLLLRIRAIDPALYTFGEAGCPGKTRGLIFLSHV
jgi:hypothetical protein